MTPKIKRAESPELPVPKGMALEREVMKWRHIGVMWVLQHNPRYMDQSVSIADLELELVPDEKLVVVGDDVRSRSHLVGATAALLKSPPAKTADELARWRFLGARALDVLDRIGITCDGYKKQIRRASVLLRRLVQYETITIRLEDVMLPVEIDVRDLDKRASNYEVIVCRRWGKKAGEILFRGVLGTIADW